MKRRDFSIQLAGAGLGLALAGPARAQGGFVEGRDYLRVSPPAPFDLPPGKKVEVLEFFWYECPHCFDFEPLLEAWVAKLPADVYFRRVPVGFTARHQMTEKLYYALQDMGLEPQMHRKIFNAIHIQHVRMFTEPDIVAWVSANGVDGAKFKQMYDSFQVATKARQAQQLTDAYKLDGVPTLGFQGRYTTSGAQAGSFGRSLQVADFLIQRLRSGA